MLRRDLLKSTLATGLASALSRSGSVAESPAAGNSNDRRFWLEQMQRVAHPVLNALSQGRLRAAMPVETAPHASGDRRLTSPLEAFARTLAGIAPWLEHGPASSKEGELRAEYCALARQALATGFDPQAADFLHVGVNGQTLVEAGFLALAVLRAPQELNAKLDAGLRAQLAEALRSTRPLLAVFSNWLLFAAAVEAALCALGESWDHMRVDYALRQHMQWYVGDGAYGDGPAFHWDYYNSYVIQPFLLAILEAVEAREEAWKPMIPKVRARASRYAQVLERLIAPDGSYPVLGRSITYRGGAFHLLADVALRRALPDSVTPEQVRCALSAVLDRTLGPAASFDPNGWLRIGLAGSQNALGEGYISTGSLYLCATAFLPLGLPAEDRFWSAPAAPWSSQKAWRGEMLEADHSLDI
jgi:hypothetical protein